jgi:glyoxylase-like metal-dependent hydrolase (beta-lactamase superfamily II)
MSSLPPVRPVLSGEVSPADSGYRFRQGAFDITVLSDGFISVPGPIVAPDGTADERADVLARLGELDSLVQVKTNIPLIRSGQDLILMDIGAGAKYEPTDGRLEGNLRAAGVAPADITKIVFTHAHPDHIWATLADDGSLRYPNATYYVGAAEWDFWMDPDYLTSMPAALHDFARGSQRDLAAVADRMVRLNPGDDVVAGMRALDTAGHTPGHLSFELAGGDGLIVTADVAVNAIVSFEHPDWRFGWDTIPDLAIKNRRPLLDRAATDRTRLLGYHWPYPGLGFAERYGRAFRFVPTA